MGKRASALGIVAVAVMLMLTMNVSPAQAWQMPTTPAGPTTAQRMYGGVVAVPRIRAGFYNPCQATGYSCMQSVFASDPGPTVSRSRGSRGRQFVRMGLVATRNWELSGASVLAVNKEFWVLLRRRAGSRATFPSWNVIPQTGFGYYNFAIRLDWYTAVRRNGRWVTRRHLGGRTVYTSGAADFQCQALYFRCYTYNYQGMGLVWLADPQYPNYGPIA